MDLPTFNGERQYWPEFKNVWQMVVVPQYGTTEALAFQLKRSIKGGEAMKIVKKMWITHPGAYQLMWDRLCQIYDDPSLSVEACLQSLEKIKPVKESNYRGLVDLVDDVECVYLQLLELKQLACLTMRDVDKVSGALPHSVLSDWNKIYHSLNSSEKIQPFQKFMVFLKDVRGIVYRLAERQTSNQAGSSVTELKRIGMSHVGSSDDGKLSGCAVHKKDGIKHKTQDCEVFKKMSIKEKLDTLQSVKACFRCFGNHFRRDCKVNDACSICGKLGHNPLLCRDAIPETSETVPHVSDSEHPTETKSGSYMGKSRGTSLYAILEASVKDSKYKLNVFCDDGSDTCYITHYAAKKINARKVQDISLDVTTMGNINTSYETSEYEFSIVTASGKIVDIVAYGMEKITGSVALLNETIIKKLFPKFNPNSLQRKSESVDLLLGANYFGLHPKNEVCQAGDNLSIMRGELGICIQGCHPQLIENTKLDVNMVKIIHSLSTCSNFVHISHPEFSKPAVASKMYNFICGDDLGTEINPLCGSCKCGKCPIRGHTYSFKEEQELCMIRQNLKYDEAKSCWVTSYPWIINPSELPNNYSSALATLKSTESKLLKDTNWAKVYSDQIKDLFEKGYAQKLSSEDISKWSGPIFYISHLAVINPQSNSTPVRIVFNSSQCYKGISLNSSLAKGPDSYMNSLLGLLLRWREYRCAMVGDIKKMYYSVGLAELERHCHRFLWRDLDTGREPDIYIMNVVCMGDKPAGAIATEAIYKTADLFYEDNPEASEMLRSGTYVDDLINSVKGLKGDGGALQLASGVEKMLAKGGFKVKCWKFSGIEYEISDLSTVEINNIERNTDESLKLKGEGSNTAVLGMIWDSVNDTMLIPASLNFSNKRQGVRVQPNLESKDIPKSIPSILTRRSVLSQVMRIYDPLGILSPFTLLSKIYLRETWQKKLEWDEQLPPNLHKKWVDYFVMMCKLEKLSYDRCLCPEDAVGLPCLILFSDGSDLAYGFVAFIRWQLKSGEFWCRLVMSKCRIAPLNKISTPQMELNGAVLSKRGRKLLEKELRFKFDKILHVVDSETVLCMLKKVSTRFNVYHGVRIGEIQEATGGDMSSWIWLPGEDNISDWLTRGRLPEELDHNSEWWLGPSILYKPIDEWNLKTDGQYEGPLPGEKKISISNIIKVVHEILEYRRFSRYNRLIHILTCVLCIIKGKSFTSGAIKFHTPEISRKAERLILLNVQSTMLNELKSKAGKGKFGGVYANLNPLENSDGLYVVGHRLLRHNPMTLRDDPQVLLPTRHYITQLLMKQAHVDSVHRGRDATLARFRLKFWTPHGSKLAWTVVKNCQLCRLRDARLLEQVMGILPIERLKPSPPFNAVMVDIFGPYNARGEVQKRISLKTYGVIYTDLVMRAVHVEFVFGYDTASFLSSFSRFTSIRGCPEIVFSDPGSQLIGASNELKRHWNSLDRELLIRQVYENGIKWVFGPADTPWHQGAVESLIKPLKRAINFTIHNQRLTASEFLTLGYEMANILNERPIGVLPGPDSPINLLTPNCLLLGRATAKNPGGWQPYIDSSSATRYNLIQQLSQEFWSQWTKLCAPSLVLQKKWHTSQRNLIPGDIVLIVDSKAIKSEYRIAKVHKVYPGVDGKVRKVDVMYKNFKIGENVSNFGSELNQIVSRSVHRLVLLVPVDFKNNESNNDL